METRFAEEMKLFGIALDPIHIGTGGYRLGGVENTIVRDPTTGVPKIPGTSLAGVIREYVTIHLMEKDSECKSRTTNEDKRKCAEKKAARDFGDENRQGILRIHDAHILFFPVSSIQGTVWITTVDLLKNVAGRTSEKIPRKTEEKAYAVRGIDKTKPLNLGWLLLETENVSDITLPPKLDEFVKGLAIVSDKLFSQIVNDNLEVRTSVRIDPVTGTAMDGALFTYEAIPRGTVFSFDIVIDRRKDTAQELSSLIEQAFPYLRLLGIGGMGTRGFGRIDIFVEQNMSNRIGKGGSQHDQP